MGNFASSSEWVHTSDEVHSSRQTITPCTTLPIVMPKTTEKSHGEDIVTLLVAKAITTCKQSIHHVLSTAIDKLSYSDDATEVSTTCDEEDIIDDIFSEFQIVYEDNYVPKTRKVREQTTPQQPAEEIFKEAPWFQYSPCDFQTVETVTAAKWKTIKNAQDDDDCRSATTESTEWLSENDDTASENPASSTCSDLDDLEFYDESDDVETKAARLLRMASNVGEEKLLFVDDYICHCGKCPQYETIENDVSDVLTWHEPEELISITRILQAFSTYNEIIGYHPDMITTADECLRLWNGDEDQAFSSFVVLQDDVPFLCGSIV